MSTHSPLLVPLWRHPAFKAETLQRGNKGTFRVMPAVSLASSGRLYKGLYVQAADHLAQI